MNRQPVSSSLIASIGIEDTPEGAVMEIQFASGGKVYAYTGPKVREHYEALLKAESVGKYFLRNVKTCPHTEVHTGRGGAGMSGRKPPKRACADERKPLTTTRLAELTEIITNDGLVAGPQDQADLVDALRELIDRRDAEAIAAALPTQPREAAA